MIDATPRASRAGRLEGIDARAEHRPQRDRDARRPALDERHAAVAPLERAVLEERPDRLADEQRVAGGPLVDAARAVGIDGRTGDERREPRGLGFGEALQVETLDARTVHPGRDPGRSRPGEDDATGGWRSSSASSLDQRRRSMGPASAGRRRRRPAARTSVRRRSDVEGRDLGEDGRDLGRVARHVRRLLLPPAERRVPGDGGDGAAESARPLPGGRSSVNSSSAHERARVDPVLVGDGLREEAGEAIRLARGRYETFSVQVQREAGGTGVALDCRQQSRLAHAGFADHDDDAATAGRAGSGRWRSSSAASSSSPADEGAGGGGTDTGSRHRCPPRLAARGDWTGVDWPRRTTEPRSSAARRPRAAASVAPSSRISPGRARDWMRAAVVIASPVSPRSPPPSPLGPRRRPRRSRSRSGPPSARAPSASSAGRADRHGRKRGADGIVIMEPRPAEDREHGIADEFLARALEPLDRPWPWSRAPPSTRARTSSGSCSASMRT